MNPYVYNTSFKTIDNYNSVSNGAGGLQYMAGTVKKLENTNVPLMNNGSNNIMTNSKDGGIIDIQEDTLHTELDPRIWNEEGKLIPIVRDKLLGIASLFKEELGLYVVEDIRLTGSEANYNYNEFSDIDLHLIYDWDKLNIDKSILEAYFKAKKKIFNAEYDFMIKKISVEVGVEDLNNSTLVATGVYSILNDEWIKKPENAGKEIDDPDTTELNYIIQKIEKAIESKDKDLIKQVWKEIRHLRKDSLAQGGEFSSGNLIFKQLRNGKYIERLKDALNDAISQELSLENKTMD